MNLLSFTATVTAVLYAVLLFHRACSCRRDSLLRISLAVCACLGWWAVCDAFFYVAPTVERAWLWHHLGALGWCGFVPTTAWYFLVMTGADRVWRTPARAFAYWGPPLALTLRFLCPGPTAFAENLVQSTSGLGWTYVEGFHNAWPYLYLGMVAVYLGGSLAYLYYWQQNKNSSSTQILATEFVVLDLLAVTVGILTVYMIPFHTDLLPPMGCVATLIFIGGYWENLREHDLLHVELALNPGSVFETSLDAMLITDASFCILYANSEARRLLEAEQPVGQELLVRLNGDEQNMLKSFALSGEERRSSLNLTLDGSTPLVCSVTHSTTLRREHDVFIFSLHDVTQLRQAQEKLDYLAHFDELTGLPNRRRLGEILDEWERDVQNGVGDFLLMFLDLNNFKSINDRFGHAAGDTALQAVAQALKVEFSETGETARLSGDEFIVLMKADTCPPKELARKICRVIAGVDCGSFAPGASLDAAVGWCAYSEAGSVRALFKLADERMYALKERCHARREE